MKDAPNHVLFVTGKVRFRSSCLHLLHLMKGIKDAGVEVSLVCASMGLEQEAARLGVKGMEWRGAPGGWAWPLWPAAARKAMTHWGVDLVHIHGQRLGFVLRGVVGASRRPVVFTPEPFLFDAGRVWAAQRMARRVIALSESIREDCVNLARTPRDKIVVLPQGVDLDATPVSLPRIGERIPVVGAVGPLYPGKGQEVLLRSAREILDSGRRCQFMIAGDGPGEGPLRRLCDELGLAHDVTFVTRLKEYLSALSCLDVFVRPTLSDGLGFTLLQAMACGKAVVATDVGGAYSLIEDGVTGRLVAKDRSDKLTEAIADLLDHPAMAQQFGRNARDFARDRFPMQAAVQQTLAVYRDAMAPRRRV